MINYKRSDNLKCIYNSINDFYYDFDFFKNNINMSMPYLYYNFNTKVFKFERSNFDDFIFCLIDVTSIIDEKSLKDFLFLKLEDFCCVYINENILDIIDNKLPLTICKCYDILIELNSKRNINLKDPFILKYLKKYLTLDDIIKFLDNSNNIYISSYNKQTIDILKFIIKKNVNNKQMNDLEYNNPKIFKKLKHLCVI